MHPLTDVEAKLSADCNGVYLKSLLGSFSEYTGEIDALVARGLSQKEYPHVMNLRAALINSSELVKEAWTIFHK